jgi:hypothetical protein
MSVTTRRSHRRRSEGLDGTEGNERLTALTGAVLLVGFAVEGLTIPVLGRLLTLHFFLGMLLIGPVALKIASTCYRIVRYYAGAAPYVRRGPPVPLLRALGPLVIITSLAVLGTGVALALAGPGPGRWLLLHKVSFVLWFGVMTIHVAAHAWRLPRILLGRPDRGSRPAAPDYRSRAAAPGAGTRVTVPGGQARWVLVGASLAGGLLLALLTVHLVTPWR